MKKTKQDQLLKRDEFRKAVFDRDDWECVWCGNPAADAHHIVERKLWDDGGYYLDNGVSVCPDCHLAAEMTIITCEQLREKAGITRVLLPKTLDPAKRWDKWGNQYWSPHGLGTFRLEGPLFRDENVQKVLKAGDQLKWFMNSA